MTEKRSDDDALRPGNTLGRYTLVRPIARGGMARVWAARLRGSRGFAKLVAVKVILPEYSREPEYERMFLDEARVASAIHHPNVCEIYELGKEDGRLYMAMEFIDGDSLSSLLQAGSGDAALPYDIAARVIADACAGLHAVHEASDDNGNLLNVIHRDISPHNILISASGNVKVADFGVAKAAQQMHHKTKTGQVKGKVCYIAPEQLTGDTFDRRSDLFSMGCVLYQATVGRRPFRAEDDLETMHQIIRGDYELPVRQRSDFPRALEAIVCRALALRPEDRFATAAEMARALSEWLAESPTIVRQSHVAAILTERLAESIQRNRELARTVAAFASSPDVAAAAAEATGVEVVNEETAPAAPGSIRKQRLAGSNPGAVAPSRSATTSPSARAPASARGRTWAVAAAVLAVLAAVAAVLLGRR